MAGFRGNAILRRLPKEPAQCRAAEVGCSHGALSSWLLGWHRGLYLLMIDWWAVPDPGSPYARTGDPAARRTQDRQNRLKKQAYARTAIAADRRHIYELPSLDAARVVTNKSLDLVFLDADHSREGVAADIEAWLPKVRPGGWLAGHDYNPRGSFPGVHRAVDAKFGRNVKRDEDGTWFVQLLEVP